MSPERLARPDVKTLIPPVHFRKRLPAAYTCQEIRSGKPVLASSEINELAVLANALSDFYPLIDEGKATIVMIKPHAEQGTYSRFSQTPSDEKAAGILASEIGSDRIAFSISLTLSGMQAKAFYEPNRKKQQQVIMADGKTLWKQVIDFTVSGPITILIVKDESGHAAENMREKIGATRPSKAAPGSLRDRYGLDTYLPNNLLHTSDSRQSAKRELEVIKRALLSLAKTAKPKSI